MNKRQTSKGLVLYQEVLQKNFEIIETFLNKFPMIFKKQDYFEDSIKKINDKLIKHEQQNEKMKEQLQMTSAMLDKKISNVKDHSSRNSRSSVRVSQQIIPLEERKNSIFRISSAFKEQRDPTSHFSKEKAQLLAEMDRKQQESYSRIEQIEEAMDKFKQKMNFLSVMNGKIQEKIDHLSQFKVDKRRFQELANDYNNKFESMIHKMVDDKYHLGGKLIDKKVSIMELSLSKYIDNLAVNVKSQLLREIEKKAGISEFRDELGEVKVVIEKMVEESVESFASKQETKKALLLFEKKFVKLQIVLQQLLSETMKGLPEDELTNCMTVGPRRQKQGVMGGFGRKRRVVIDK